MSDFAPGDVVTSVKYDCPYCIEDEATCGYGEARAVGGAYRVAAIVSCPTSCDDVYLVGDPSAYCALGFRKIRPASKKFTRQIRACRPIKTKVKA